MDRRNFLKNLPLLGFLLIKTQNAVSSVLSPLIFAGNDDSGGSFLTIRLDNKTAVKLPVFMKNNLAYISAFKFAGSLQYHTYFNDSKRKVVLYFPGNQVVVTANNSFVIVDDEAYQMPAPALWKNGEIFVPVKYFAPLLSRRTTLHLNYKEDQQLLEVTHQDINITGVQISAKENGTLIRVQTTREFNPGEITADMRYGWLHVDFYGGKTDPAIIGQTKTDGLVRKVKTFQFSELLSLAFLLRSEPLSKEIITKPENNEVLIVLRTNDDLSDEELSELREEEPAADEPSDEIKRQLEEERKKWLIDVVVIDPGHGGKDPGAIGSGKLYEKDVVLPIAQKLGKIIPAPTHPVCP
ncbi:MAG: N-acetylmuramoyl-L-alanine amidase [Calditrichia bacterium]